MTEKLNLNDLLIDISQVADENLEEFAQNLYRELYITDETFGLHQCHDGELVKFWDSRFKHAFFNTIDYRLSSEKKIVDKRRVERMKWIGALIGGNAIGSQCWLIQKERRQRCYMINAKNFVVWLEPLDGGGWWFSTIYTPDTNQMYRYTRGNKLIWKN